MKTTSGPVYDDKSDIATMTQLLEKLIVEDKVDFVLAESPGAFEGSSMPASFGILFIMQNGLILIWGADIRKYAFLDCAVSLRRSSRSRPRRQGPSATTPRSHSRVSLSRRRRLYVARCWGTLGKRGTGFFPPPLTRLGRRGCSRRAAHGVGERPLDVSLLID